MYNIAKHVIHVKESSNAAFLAASKIAEAHRILMLESKHRSVQKTSEGVQALIQHKLTLLECYKLQAQSLDTRAQNMTNLVRHSQRGLYSLGANVLAGFQHREPTRPPDDEG